MIPSVLARPVPPSLPLPVAASTSYPSRLDPNAIKLLNLYPASNQRHSLGNYGDSPALSEHRNSFDTRLDLNFSDKNQLFYRFSLVDDPQFIPGIFGGVADGGAFQEGNQTALAQQSASGVPTSSPPTWLTSPAPDSITCTPHGFHPPPTISAISLLASALRAFHRFPRMVDYPNSGSMDFDSGHQRFPAFG